MNINLLEALAQVPDFRAPRGRRYSLQLILLLVIMGTLSNCLGYQALEDFARRHRRRRGDAETRGRKSQGFETPTEIVDFSGSNSGGVSVPV